MQILIASCAGFCEGVERAYRIATQQAQSRPPVFMLGNLVHNQEVVKRLRELGIKSVKKLAQIPGGTAGTLLISAHGVAPQVYQEARDRGLEIVDTTCPWVKKAQKICGQLAGEGCRVIIVGDKGHPEVKGLVGWSKGRAEVIEEIKDIKEIKDAEAGVLAQTTQAEEHFKQMVSEIKKQVKRVKEYNTICGATAKRQNAAVALAQQADLMLVIGDKKSANTKRLKELCQKTGTRTHQIQTAKELKASWFTKVKRVGVTAGASTPGWVIQAVMQKLENLQA